MSVTITGVTAGQTYYIKALDDTTGPGAIGSFGLAINFGSQTLSPVAPPNTVVASQPDQGGGTELDAIVAHFIAITTKHPRSSLAVIRDGAIKCMKT